MTAWVGNQVWVEPDGRSYIPAAPALALSRLGQHKKAWPTFWPRIAHFITFVEPLSSYYCFNTGSFQPLIEISINLFLSTDFIRNQVGHRSVVEFSVGFLNVKGRLGGAGQALLSVACCCLPTINNLLF